MTKIFILPSMVSLLFSILSSQSYAQSMIGCEDMRAKDKLARVTVELNKSGQIQSIFYYAKIGPRTCNINVVRGNKENGDMYSKSRWFDNGDRTTKIFLDPNLGTLTLEKKSAGEYVLNIKDADRYKLCSGLSRDKMNFDVTISSKMKKSAPYTHGCSSSDPLLDLNASEPPPSVPPPSEEDDGDNSI